MAKPAASATVLQCLQCGEATQLLGTFRFRTGGPPAGWRLFRDWEEMDEDLLPIDVHVCLACRRVELGVPEGMAIKPR